MTNNSDGLSPTLRPQLGIGWNRALPAPFGFDNGLNPDGVNDSLIIPGFAGIVMPQFWTLEYWAITTSTTTENSRFCGIFGTSPNFQSIFDTTLLSGRINWNMACYNASVNPAFSGAPLNQKNHIVWAYNGTQLLVYLNGTLQNAMTVTSLFPTTIGTFRFGLGGNGFPFPFSNIHFDEVRLYSKVLTQQQISLNYNNGVGNNPDETEFLMLWLKFEQFETLDFSASQDGSDLRLGIRDLSNNNRHAQPINMDTNPASPTYVLKPF